MRIGDKFLDKQIVFFYCFARVFHAPCTSEIWAKFPFQTQNSFSNDRTIKIEWMTALFAHIMPRIVAQRSHIILTWPQFSIDCKNFVIIGMRLEYGRLLLWCAWKSVYKLGDGLAKHQKNLRFSVNKHSKFERRKKPELTMISFCRFALVAAAALSVFWLNESPSELWWFRINVFLIYSRSDVCLGIVY